MNNKFIFQMDSVYESFWLKEYDNSVKLNKKMIEECESQLNHKLPKELLDLLEIQNGGYTKDLYIIDNRLLNIIEISEVFGVYFDEVNPSILDSDYLCKEWELPNQQVLICGDGHTWMTLDYSNEMNVRVRYIDLEEDINLIISESFGDFISRLKLKR